MLKIALVDDEQDHIELLQEYLKRFGQEEDVLYETEIFRNGLNFVEDYQGKTDVVFLDIEMPHMDGLEAARRIRKKDNTVGIVFVTNMAQYAIKGYEVNAIDFIVKPVEYYVFADKMKKAIQFTKQNTERVIAIETEDSVEKITLSKIIYVEKEKNYIVYHVGDRVYRERGTMKDMEKILLPEGFGKCINGCLVNLRYITKLDRDVVWLGEEQLPISRQHRKELKEAFLKYVGGGAS